MGAGRKKGEKVGRKVKERGLLSGPEEKRPAKALRAGCVTTSAGQGSCARETDKVTQGRDEKSLLSPIRARTPNDRPSTKTAKYNLRHATHSLHIVHIIHTIT